MCFCFFRSVSLGSCSLFAKSCPSFCRKGEAKRDCKRTRLRQTHSAFVVAESLSDVGKGGRTGGGGGFVRVPPTLLQACALPLCLCCLGWLVSSCRRRRIGPCALALRRGFWGCWCAGSAHVVVYACASSRVAKMIVIGVGFRRFSPTVPPPFVLKGRT